MDQRNQWAPRQWFTGEWTCSECGAKIDRLPFNPDPNRLNTLLCKDCHRAKMGNRNRR
jgi:CxxC-x17-CxxC domain-containing protein